MDCYTSWCGPCKYMTGTIFPQEKAGEFFNPKFVCVKFDMEKGEGPELGKKIWSQSLPNLPNSTSRMERYNIKLWAVEIWTNLSQKLKKD